MCLSLCLYLCLAPLALDLQTVDFRRSDLKLSLKDKFCPSEIGEINWRTREKAWSLYSFLGGGRLFPGISHKQTNTKLQYKFTVKLNKIVRKYTADTSSTLEGAGTDASEG